MPVPILLHTCHVGGQPRCRSETRVVDTPELYLGPFIFFRTLHGPRSPCPTPVVLDDGPGEIPSLINDGNGAPK